MRKYTIVPLPVGIFTGITPLSRMCFGFIWDRYRVSGYNVAGTAGASRWVDDETRDVFCLYSHRELAADMGASERTVRRCLDELRDAGLIWWKRDGYQGPCRFFVHEGVAAYMRPSNSVTHDRAG